MAISIGDAILFLSADDKQLKKGLKGGEAAVKSSSARMSRHAEVAGARMTSALGGMAGRLAAGMTAYLGVSALTNYTNKWIQLGDQVEEQSQRTGLSVEMISRLNYVAGKAGLTLEKLEVTTRQMAKAIGNAGMNTKILGLSVRDLVAMSPDQQFMKMLEALSQVENLTLRSALAMKYFGRSGTEILPLIAGGMEGLADEMARADKSGVVFTAEEAANAASYADAIQHISNKWIQLGGAIAQSNVGGSIMKIMDDLTALMDVRGLDDFLDTLSEAYSAMTGGTNKRALDKTADAQWKLQKAKERNEKVRRDMANGWGVTDKRAQELAKQVPWGYESGMTPDDAQGPMLGPQAPYRPDPYARNAYRRQGSAQQTYAGRMQEGDYYGATQAQRYGMSEQELAARNVQYNTTVISHANFSAGDDMVKAYNKRMSQRPF